MNMRCRDDRFLLVGAGGEGGGALRGPRSRNEDCGTPYGQGEFLALKPAAFFSEGPKVAQNLKKKIYLQTMS